MRRFLIQGINCGLVIIILIGVPAVTGTQMGTLQVSSTRTARMLILWGLSLAAAGNAATALGWAKDRMDRTLCWKWAVAFGVLLGVEYACFQGHLNFNWLKQTLLWLQKLL